MPDFGDAEGMAAAAWDMASAFGLTVEQAGNLGIALGQFEPELAEAAAKAVIFQEAFGNLLGQFQAGNLDTTGFMTAYDQHISDMQNKSLIEIQVDLKMPERVPTGQNAISPYLPDFSSEPIEVPISIVPAPTAADNALSTALTQIDGIPAEQEKHITFSATYSAVTPTATDAIQTAINAIESEVDLIPNTSLVDAEIARIDQSRITVYVDYVTTGSPPEGKASGGPVRGGVPYKVGEVGPELFIPWTDDADTSLGQVTARYQILDTTTAGVTALNSAVRTLEALRGKHGTLTGVERASTDDSYTCTARCIDVVTEEYTITSGPPMTAAGKPRAFVTLTWEKLTEWAT